MHNEGWDKGSYQHYLPRYALSLHDPFPHYSKVRSTSASFYDSQKPGPTNPEIHKYTCQSQARDPI